jgi:trigger factor
VAHLRRVYGRSVMADLVQKQIDAAHKEIIEGHNLRLAMQPRIELSKEQNEIDAALEAKGDLAFKIELEVLPQFELGGFDDIALERPVADVTDEEVERFVQRIADNRRNFVERPEGEPAENGDKLTVDFVGRIDGVEFEGGKGEAIDVILGAKSFIPGFEEALVGAKAGEERSVEARFPDNYANSALAGKTGVFETKVAKVAKPEELALDDEFAKSVGYDSMEAMRKAIRDRLEADYARVSREKVKRRLLDELAKRYSFELPRGLVDQEFGQIWAQVEREQKAGGKSFADENTTEEAARAEYMGIAERRVRLGLVLAEVGRAANVEITEEELTRALIERARAFPGQEQEVWNYYRNNQGALAELRAPIYEEKAVDHILGLARIEDQKVAPEELLKPEPDEAPKAALAAPASEAAPAEPSESAPAEFSASSESSENAEVAEAAPSASEG